MRVRNDSPRLAAELVAVSFVGLAQIERDECPDRAR